MGWWLERRSTWEGGKQERVCYFLRDRPVTRSRRLSATFFGWPPLSSPHRPISLCRSGIVVGRGTGRSTGTDMTFFCPTCSNMLLIGNDNASGYNWTCSTCPFIFPIQKQMTTRTPLPRKQVDDVMGDKGWQNVDSTESESIVSSTELHCADSFYFRQLLVLSATTIELTTCSCRSGM